MNFMLSSQQFYHNIHLIKIYFNNSELQFSVNRLIKQLETLISFQNFGILLNCLYYYSFQLL